MKEKYLVKEAALILGISKDTIYNKIKRGQLESIKENGKIFVLIENTQNSLQDEIKKLKEENFKLKAQLDIFKNKLSKLSSKKIKKDKEYIKLSKLCQIHNITKEKQKILKDKISKNFKNIDFIKIKDGKFFVKKDVDILALMDL